MFEKEAIRHAFEDTIGVECLIKPVEDFTYEELSDEQQEKAYDFKKGAEFGYNKANEWHYDEPTESKNNFYVILKNGNHRICYWDLTSKAYKWLKNVVNGEHITFNLIRCWKEIVLPKESE